MTWQAFVLAYGWQARRDHLAHILDVSGDAIDLVRRTGAATKGRRREFAELFTLWKGRAPSDDEWPRPRRWHGTYEWLGPELALLASLVGRLGPAEIATTLTTRLRQVTGDAGAMRTRISVQIRTNLLGLQTSDVVGGLTANQAGRSIGCISIIYNDIRQGRLTALRVGRHLVIAHDEFERWKAARVFPPKGFVSLASLKRPLGITSDKLSEWARAGYVPTAIRCNPYGTRAASTKFGTWYIDAKVKRKLIGDRRAGRPMPWWRQPEPYNLKVTWRLYDRRRHPEACATCRDIWGKAGAPRTFEDYRQRYPPLAHGAKRHLTRVWSPGLAIDAVARLAGVSESSVMMAIRNGVLHAEKHGRHWYVARVDATRWKWRRATTGSTAKSWLSIASACQQYGFTRAELRQYIVWRRLRTKVGTFGAASGVRYVLKLQVSALREQLGFSHREAARRAGVSVARLRVLLRGLEWRPAPRIPLQVVQNVIKRKYSQEGRTIAEAARALKKSVGWVEREIARGTARVSRTRWSKERRYVSAPMFARLRKAVRHPTTHQRWTADWLLVSEASLLAGVSATQIQRWSNLGEVATRMKGRFRRFHRRSVMVRARQYWASEVRYTRAQPPGWLQAERSTAAA